MGERKERWRREEVGEWERGRSGRGEREPGRNLSLVHFSYLSCCGMGGRIDQSGSSAKPFLTQTKTGLI